MRWKILIMALVFGMFVHIVLLHSVSATTSVRVIELTKTSSTDIFSSWSPDGKRITFVSILGEKSDIWIMDWDGRNKIRATDSGKACDPRWSPDGSKIAFSWNHAGNFDIWVMDDDGKNKVQLTTDPAADLLPSWSPDGKRILFISNRSGRWGLWVMDSNGEYKIHLNTPVEVMYAEWSPDGKRIAFSSGTDIWVMDRDGKNIKRLTGDEGVEKFPSWSPDGGKIAFNSVHSGHTDVWVMDDNGSNKVRLTEDAHFAAQPLWSPDGKKLALFGRFNLSAPYGIWIIDINGSKRMQLATFRPPSSLKPAWSPDGRKIGYTSSGNISVIILDEDITAPEAGKTTGFDALIAILVLVAICSIVRMRR